MAIAGDGALAQLGEHLLCKQRVVGSIPTGSTILPRGGLYDLPFDGLFDPGKKQKFAV